MTVWDTRQQTNSNDPSNKTKQPIKQKQTTRPHHSNFQAIGFSPTPWACLRHLSSQPLPYLQQVPPGRVVDRFLHLPHEEMRLETRSYSVSMTPAVFGSGLVLFPHVPCAVIAGYNVLAGYDTTLQIGCAMGPHGLGIYRYGLTHGDPTYGVGLD
jgi:hypothetical protein